MMKFLEMIVLAVLLCSAAASDATLMENVEDHGPLDQADPAALTNDEGGNTPSLRGGLRGNRKLECQIVDDPLYFRGTEDFCGALRNNYLKAGDNGFVRSKCKEDAENYNGETIADYCHATCHVASIPIADPDPVKDNCAVHWVYNVAP